jgi:nucleoid-associated protein YgaU
VGGPGHSSALITPTNVSDTETNNYEELEKEKLLNIIKQKEVLLSELNRNLGQKEATSHVERRIAVETKTKQAEVIKDLRQKSSIYRIGLYVAIGVFFCAVALIKTLGNNSTPAPKPIQTKPTSPVVKLDLLPNTNETMQTVNPNERDNRIVIDYPTEEDQIHSTSNSTSDPSLDIAHLVKKGESLWKITGKYLGKEKSYLYKKVMEYNGLTSEVAPVGKTIKIPPLAELED